MEDVEIRRVLEDLDMAKGVADEEKCWELLKPLGATALPYFLECYPKMKSAKGRVSLVFHAMKYGRTHDEAFRLGLAALNDKATLVRYRACMLLAYSLKREALSPLKSLLNHKDKKTVEDAKAAIDAIKHQNHNYFIDRTHSGRMFLNMGGETPI